MGFIIEIRAGAERADSRHDKALLDDSSRGEKEVLKSLPVLNEIYVEKVTSFVNGQPVRDEEEGMKREGVKIRVEWDER